MQFREGRGEGRREGNYAERDKKNLQWFRNTNIEVKSLGLNLCTL